MELADLLCDGLYDALLECPIDVCARYCPTADGGLVDDPMLLATELAEVFRDAVVVDGCRIDVPMFFGPACNVFLTAPLTCRMVGGAAGFALGASPARSASVFLLGAGSGSPEGLCLSPFRSGGGIIADAVALTLFSDADISVSFPIGVGGTILLGGRS